MAPTVSLTPWAAQMMKKLSAANNSARITATINKLAEVPAGGMARMRASHAPDVTHCMVPAAWCPLHRGSSDLQLRRARGRASQDYALSQQANQRKGGLLCLAAAAVSISHPAPVHSRLSDVDTHSAPASDEGIA